MTALAWLALAAVVLAGAGLAYLIGSDLIDRARADDQLPTDDFDRHADDALAVGNDTYPCGCGRMCPLVAPPVPTPASDPDFWTRSAS